MLWVGLVLCALCGIEFGAVLAGIVANSVGTTVVLTVVGANLLPWTAIGGFAAVNGGLRRRLPFAGPVRFEAAAAKIESSRATGEGPDIPLRLDLTVAPTGAPAYRVESTVVVNLMDLDDYRVGRMVVVDHAPERPWQVTVRRHPGPEWVGRIALTKIDSAPVETRATEPRTPRLGSPRIGLTAAGVGLVLSVLPFWSIWGELLG